MKITILLISIFVLLLIITITVIVIKNVKEHKEEVDEHLRDWEQRTNEQQMYEDGIRNW